MRMVNIMMKAAYQIRAQKLFLSQSQSLWQQVGSLDINWGFWPREPDSPYKVVDDKVKS